MSHPLRGMDVLLRGIPAAGGPLKKGVHPIYPPGCLRSPETVYYFDQSFYR